VLRDDWTRTIWTKAVIFFGTWHEEYFCTVQELHRDLTSILCNDWLVYTHTYISPYAFEPSWSPRTFDEINSETDFTQKFADFEFEPSHSSELKSGRGSRNPHSKVSTNFELEIFVPLFYFESVRRQKRGGVISKIGEGSDFLRVAARRPIASRFLPPPPENSHCFWALFPPPPPATPVAGVLLNFSQLPSLSFQN
jgi:hypothetical protein